MQTKNVYYGSQPDRVMVYGHGDVAVVEFPVYVIEEENEEGIQWKAETVYSLRTFNSEGLIDRINNNYELWLEKAMADEPTNPVTIEEVSGRLTNLEQKVDGELAEATDIISIMTGGEE